VEIASSAEVLSIALRHDYELLRNLSEAPSVIPSDSFLSYPEWFCETMLGFVAQVGRQRSGGLALSRSLVSLLRTDAETAQRHFDEIVQRRG
jgi:hypothetical protein